MKIGVNHRFTDQDGSIGSEFLDTDGVIVTSRQVLRRIRRKAEAVFIGQLKDEARRLRVKGGSVGVKDRATARTIFRPYI